MPLDECPHMFMRCPHYQKACRDAASKDCHHIKRTRAAMIAAASAMQGLDVERLPEEMNRFREDVQAFLGETAFLSKRDKGI